MRINTTGVTSIERALKALNRIEEANSYLLSKRAISGAMKNRSEYTYERNQNYVENIENADSVLRDADIPTEIAETSRNKLIMQAQTYMLSMQKENQQHNNLLDSLA